MYFTRDENGMYVERGERRYLSWLSIYLHSIPDTCSKAQHDLRGRFNENIYPI